MIAILAMLIFIVSVEFGPFYGLAIAAICVFLDKWLNYLDREY